MSGLWLARDGPVEESLGVQGTATFQVNTHLEISLIGTPLAMENETRSSAASSVSPSSLILQCHRLAAPANDETSRERDSGPEAESLQILRAPWILCSQAVAFRG